ncbi:zona pellucida sperm-binding protein 2-like [Oncorhynchus masou masou]|uniref:zona pellucida sperm-binding protein 2-like n=1 Tax=Oncorhynchus masou masou TaxID=90313 RepID=UPI0031839611
MIWMDSAIPVEYLLFPEGVKVMYKIDFDIQTVPEQPTGGLKARCANFRRGAEGIDAKRLDTEEMAARNYSVLVTEAHIVEIPVGAVGGYFKSHIQDDQYFVTYTIESMLEFLWIEEVAHEDTSYKVLFPITTPPMARPPQVCNYESDTPLDTVPEQAVFVLELWTFNLDWELLNIHFESTTHTSGSEGDADFTITLPFSSPDAVFESVHSSSVRSRLDVALLHPYNKYFSMACSFIKTPTECFSNGTMTAVKVESAPGLNPGQLTLSDPACGPTYSDNRFAYFHFTVNSCGTTRKMNLRLKVSCYYVANITRTLAFLTRPRNKPFAETGVGRQMVRMRLAQNTSYNTFHQEEDYPVVRYLRQPLHFEVELTTSSDPKVALVLDHCWATLNEDRDS